MDELRSAARFLQDAQDSGFERGVRFEVRAFQPVERFHLDGGFLQVVDKAWKNHLLGCAVAGGLMVHDLETMAHLELLVARGELSRTEDGARRYALIRTDADWLLHLTKDQPGT